jgi:hypothetical protein
MSLPESQPNGKREIYFDSSECDLIMIEGPGDTTVRPRPPHVPRYAPSRTAPESASNGETTPDLVESPLIIIEGPGDTTVRPRPPHVPRYGSGDKPPVSQAPPKPEKPDGAG